MSTPLRALIVEDSQDDAAMLLRELRRAGYEVVSERVETARDMNAALDRAEWDVILSDYTMPHFSAPDALAVLKNRQLDVPFIIISGTIGEEAAVNAMKAGAHDFMIKGSLARLSPALERELREVRIRREQRRVEEALRRSEAYLAAGERLSHTGSWSWNLSSGELFWSQETYRIFGFDPEKDKASLGDTFLARIHPEDRASVEAGLRNPKAQDAVDYRIVLPEGSIRHIHDIPYAVTDATGKVVERFGVACDVTERKHAEDSLRESEERFRQIAETIDEVFWVADPNITKMLYVSPAYERVWGRSIASLYENPRSFLESIHSDDRDRAFAILGTQKSGQSFDHEYRVVRPDGAVRWIWDRGFPVRDEAGQVNRFVGVAVDITERKRTEAELLEQKNKAQIYVDVAGIMLLALNPNQEVVLINLMGCAILGYSREEIIGKHWCNNFVPARLRNMLNLAFEKLKAGDLEAVEYHENPIVTKTGEERLIAWHNTVLRDGSGKIVTTLSSGEDITERKSLESQFRQAQKMEAVGRLAGGVAHDFNNLLTIINGYSEMVLDRLDPSDPTRGHLEEVRKAGERAVSLTRQLLAFSRQQVLEPRVLDLNAVVADVEKMLRRLIGEDIELAIVRGSALRRVKADPGQIEQIIVNLAVNARDAMPQGGKLVIETANVELDEAHTDRHGIVPPGRYVQLAMSDTGIGMDAETQAHIFEPFFTTKEKDKGTGLGLAMVYGIVKQSGGFIWVYSEPGRGTTFKIYLPRVEEAGESVQALKSQGHSVAGSETILLVEDEEAVRALAVSILRARGYNVLESKSPEDAIQIGERRHEPIHLLLTDVVMPGMSGRKVAEHLAFLRPEMKVLFMSGYTDDSVVRHGVREANTAFLQKPFTPSSLSRKVREVLDARREEKI